MRIILRLAIAMLLVSACSSDTPSGDGGAVAVPNDLMGIYAGGEDDDHRLTIGPMGMKSSGIICSQNLSFTSFEAAGENKWKFIGDDSNGMIVKTGDGLNISVGGDAYTGCHAEGLTGLFSKAAAPVKAAPAAKPAAKPAAPAPAPQLTEIPEKLRGKYKKKNGTGKSASDDATMVVTKRKMMVTNCYNWEDYCNVTVTLAGVEEDEPLYTVHYATGGGDNTSFTLSLGTNSIDLADHSYWAGTWVKQ